jgi:hypothetical protein
MEDMSDIQSSTPVKLNPGDHLCSIYQNTDQKLSVVVPFIVEGLTNNQKCICVIDAAFRDMLLGALENQRFPTKHYLDSKQLIIQSAEEIYAKDSFDPTTMIAFVKKLEEDAISEGYAGIRGIGEMAWPSTEDNQAKLIAYESQLNTLLTSSSSLLLCQYDERTFDEKTLIDAIRTHPALFLYGKYYVNKYFYSPPEYMKSNTMKFGEDSYKTIVDTIISD